MSANLLHRESSPYLRQHADNPVHWRAWGSDALAEAAGQGKPILLSIGYAACHWCHVMAHESFADPETAAVMNRLFVNIKVDREERPDIDHIYMRALQALGEQGGWPLTMFLTPAGEPIWGGTYFPKTAGYGRPAFREVLQSVAHSFAEAPDRVEQNRTALLDHLRAAPRMSKTKPDPAVIDEAAHRLRGEIDPAMGGLQGAPKFPQPTLLELLNRSSDRTGSDDHRRAAIMSLQWMVQGGIYDHIGGGLHRYSVDSNWLVPHFEKMLYDNALLIERLTSAWIHTGQDLFRIRIEETVAWIFREMMVGDAFAASLDADTPDGEGAFYVWRPAEVEAVLGSAAATSFNAAFDITEGGNFEGRSIPNRLHDARMNRFPDTDELVRHRAALLSVRNQRQHPARDDKILADWNGLLIAALARASTVFQRSDWREAAQSSYRFITESMTIGGRLRHSTCGGSTLGVGFASDYGAMMRAAIALHQATMNEDYITDAARLADTLDRYFWDSEASAYRMTADDADDLIVRPLPLVDDSVPSANAAIAMALSQLTALSGKQQYAARADAIIDRHTGPAASVFGKAGLFNAFDQRLSGTQIVLVEPEGRPSAPWRDALRRALPEAGTLLIVADGDDLPAGHPAFGTISVGGAPTVYVCRGNTCSAPISDINEIGVAISSDFNRAV